MEIWEKKLEKIDGNFLSEKIEKSMRKILRGKAEKSYEYMKNKYENLKRFFRNFHCILNKFSGIFIQKTVEFFNSFLNSIFHNFPDSIFTKTQSFLKINKKSRKIQRNFFNLINLRRHRNDSFFLFYEEKWFFLFLKKMGKSFSGN